MRYDNEKNTVYIDVTEAAEVSRRGASVHQPYDDENMHSPLSLGTGEALERCAEAEGISLTVHGKAVCDQDGKYRLAFSFTTAAEAKRKSAEELCRAEAFLLAALIMGAHGGDAVTFVTEKHIDASGEVISAEERITRDAAERFFAKCTEAIAKTGRIEIERVTKRLPSMKAVKFPYGHVRAGQGEFIRAAYRTLSRGGELFAEAPTGTGKTVSALFPAIRALGDGRCDKAFYLTPKATTARAAKECIELTCEGGAFIRAIILTAKDKICTHGGVCREKKSLCPTHSKNRITEAMLALADLCIPVVTDAEVRRVADEYTVCPYELSLTYSELCDVVICDFNYLFDPNVYIRRFFTRGGRYAFLIDEAHNLAERAREMYSAEIKLSDIGGGMLRELLPSGAALGEAARGAAELFLNTVEPLLRDECRKDKDGVIHGAYHTRDLPSDFYDIFPALEAVAENELYGTFGARDDERDMRMTAIRDYLYKVKRFAAATARFDDGYELFLFRDGDDFTAKIFCLDTGSTIASRLALGSGSVLFSATLTPLAYYRSVLGGDRSSEMLTVDSPFDRDQLFVAIMNNITTRTSEREKSLSAVSSVIAATLSAKRGNYMIFAPSFAYAEALYAHFSKKYPKIRSIIQKPSMSAAERDEFLAEFSRADGKYLAAFCVMGGVFAEGVDLIGDKLIGAVVVGIGMPALSFEREAIAAYYQDRLDSGTEYAYLYPGMNRVLQAAGRVIRSETDRGVIVLVDDRFNDPLYKKIVPQLWHGMKFLPDARVLKEKLEEFWLDAEE